MHRRFFLTQLSFMGSMLAVATTSAWAHTPYRFWNVFRKRNMQILTSLEDVPGDDTGEAWVTVLREKLPLSRAMVSRAHKMTRTASLLKTNQVKLAVLSHAHAEQMVSGAAPFEEFGPMDLQVLVDNGKHLLMARTDLPLYHGYLVTMALMEAADALALLKPAIARFNMPLHPGAKAYFSGEKLEPPPTPAEP
jgi:hypothetical protein